MKKNVSILYYLLIGMILINCIVVRFKVALVVKNIVFILMIICAMGLAISVYDKRINIKLRIGSYAIFVFEICLFVNIVLLNNLKRVGAFYFLIIFVPVMIINYFITKKYQ